MKPKIIFWITLVVVMTALVGVVFLVGPQEVMASGYHTLFSDTEFAPGYSESAFLKIEVGDSEASVRTAIGAPLAAFPADSFIMWIYSPGPQPDFTSLGHANPVTAYTIFYFLLDGTLKGAHGQLVPIPPKGNLYTSTIGDGQNSLSVSDATIKALAASGATTADIEAKYGKPTAVYESRSVQWLIYSRSPSSSDYKRRWVGIDEHGNVSAVQSERYFD